MIDNILNVLSKKRIENKKKKFFFNYDIKKWKRSNRYEVSIFFFIFQSSICDVQ